MKLNYRGDRRNFDPNHLVGPDVGYAFLIPVAADCDAEADRTTITYEHLLREKWPAEAIVAGARTMHDRGSVLLREAMLGSSKATARLKAGSAF